MTTVKRPSVLAFRGKLLCSDAIMSSCHWDDRDNKANWKAIPVKEKSVRGTISHELKGAKATKIESEIEKANLQTVDSAALPFTHDTLKLNFTLRILGDIANPSSCNSPEFKKSLTEKVDTYAESVGFTEIAKRYATNIANARFLWNNRVGAESIEVRVSAKSNTYVFNALEHSINNFESESLELEELTKLIESALSKNEPVLLKIETFSRLGEGQAVYPSEELVLNLDKKDKSHLLYSLDGQAAMHSQKIGNALRTIDNWHSGGESQPIAVEAYGSVTSQGSAFRDPKSKTDFYNILNQWLVKGKEPSVDEQHYFMAMLIRGGVFGC